MSFIFEHPIICLVIAGVALIIAMEIKNAPTIKEP